MPILSKTNADKLCMSGIYRCEPMLNLLPSYKRNDPYWGLNWTFKVELVEDEYYMYDTYWGNDFCILLTDENFDKFEFVFDSNEVDFYRGSHWDDYDESDKWIIRLDSGGATLPKYIIKRTARPVKERVIQRLNNEINSLYDKLLSKQRDLSRVENDEVDLRYV